jgi:hypothetical protein
MNCHDSTLTSSTMNYGHRQVYNNLPKIIIKPIPQRLMKPNDPSNFNSIFFHKNKKISIFSWWRRNNKVNTSLGSHWRTKLKNRKTKQKIKNIYWYEQKCQSHTDSGTNNNVWECTNFNSKTSYYSGVHLYKTWSHHVTQITSLLCSPCLTRRDPNEPTKGSTWSSFPNKP